MKSVAGGAVFFFFCFFFLKYGIFLGDVEKGWLAISLNLLVPGVRTLLAKRCETISEFDQVALLNGIQVVIVGLQSFQSQGRNPAR